MRILTESTRERKTSVAVTSRARSIARCDYAILRVAAVLCRSTDCPALGFFVRDQFAPRTYRRVDHGRAARSRSQSCWPRDESVREVQWFSDHDSIPAMRKARAMTASDSHMPAARSSSKTARGSVSAPRR